VRLITFSVRGTDSPRIGARVARQVLDLAAAAGVAGEPAPPVRMRDLLAAGDQAMKRVRKLAAEAQADRPGFAAALLDEREIRYLPPVPDADKFLCAGKNYRSHLEELKRNELLTETPQEPTGFIKLNSSLCGHDARVARPAGVVSLDYEPELVFVIGRRALGARKKDAFDYVAGVTILNDLTCRDLQKREVASGSRFWTAKNIPGFGPLGPEIVTMDEIGDPYDLWMTCSVNGEERMRVNTRDQIWKLPDLLEHFSRYIAIEPGDMFATGAPGGVAVGKPNAAELFLKPGDVVECSIEGVATLRTHIVSPGLVERRGHAT
jgi:2-keto-4-pentenoate hydratase/2-oxohepta-3-ene-1,7-dioic acid hydratase in catechol pathway